MQKQIGFLVLGLLIGGVVMFAVMQTSWWGKMFPAEVVVKSVVERPAVVKEKTVEVVSLCTQQPDIQTVFDQNVKTPGSEAPGVTRFTIKNGNTVIGTFDREGPAEAEIMHQDACVMYFRTVPIGIGGYILFDTMNFPWYRVDLSKNTYAAMPSPALFSVQDIAPDQKSFVGVDSDGHAIVLLDMTGKELKRFPVAKKYSQYGDVYFSPNAQKIAYAAALGEPEKEQGEVFVIDLQTGKETSVISKLNGYINVSGWRDNQAPRYIEH